MNDIQEIACASTSISPVGSMVGVRVALAQVKQNPTDLDQQGRHFALRIDRQKNDSMVFFLSSKIGRALNGTPTSCGAISGAIELAPGVN